jgi:hypothetical protein
MPVILNERRRYGRVAEAFVTPGIGRRSPGDVALCCLNAVVVTLFGSLRIRRRRRIVRRRLRMRAAGNGKRKQQCCDREQFLHDVPSKEETRAWKQVLRTSSKKENALRYP